MSLRRCGHQRRPAVLLLDLEIGAGPDEQLDDIAIAFLRRQGYWGLATKLLVDPHPALDRLLNSAFIAQTH